MPDTYDADDVRLRAANVNSSLGRRGTILCVGLEVNEVSGLVGLLGLGDTTCHAIRHFDLNEILLDKLRPQLVVTPLFSESFDAVDVAEELSLAGYSGQLVALSPSVPNPGLIEAEIREYAYGMNFRLVIQDVPKANQA